MNDSAWEQLHLIQAYHEAGSAGGGNSTLKHELAKRIAELNPNLLDRYHRRIARGLTPVEYVEDEICPGCHVVIPTAGMQTLRLGSGVVYCEYCGALLLPAFRTDARHTLTPTEVERGFAVLPIVVRRLKPGVKHIEVLDIWGESYRAEVDLPSATISGLAEVYARSRAAPGRVVWVREVDRERARFRFEVEPVGSPDDSNAVLGFLLTVGEAPLSEIASSLFADQEKVFGPQVVQVSLEHLLRGDSRFSRSADGWTVGPGTPGFLVSDEDLDTVANALSHPHPVRNIEDLVAIVADRLRQEGFDGSAVADLAVAAPGSVVVLGPLSARRIALVLGRSAHGSGLRVRLRGAETWVDLPIDSRSVSGKARRARERRLEEGSSSDAASLDGIIRRSLSAAFRKDGRFTCFGPRVALTDYVQSVEPPDWSEIEGPVLQSGSPLKTETFVADLPDLGEGDRALLMLAIDCHFAEDERFLNVGGELAPVWVPRSVSPPREAVFTLTEDACREGYIEFTPGLRKIIAHIRTAGPLTFVVYGNYEVEAAADFQRGRVGGPKLAELFRENALRPGDEIHIECPLLAGDPPRLHWVQRAVESERSEPAPEPTPRHSPPRHLELRDRILHIFRSADSALHVKRIEELLAEHGVKTAPGQVNSELSRCPHLFCGRAGGPKGFWVLTEWENAGRRVPIDLTSLLLAVADEDLVVRELEAAGRPLSAQDIAGAVASYFGVAPETVIGASFIDTNDERLVRCTDGKWALRRWREDWSARAERVSDEIARLQQEDLELRRREEAARAAALSRLEELREQARHLSALEEATRTELSGLATRIQRALPATRFHWTAWAAGALLILLGFTRVIPPTGAWGAITAALVAGLVGAAMRSLSRTHLRRLHDDFSARISALNDLEGRLAANHAEQDDIRENLDRSERQTASDHQWRQAEVERLKRELGDLERLLLLVSDSVTELIPP